MPKPINRELEIIADNHENMSDDDLQRAIRLTLRSQNYAEINEELAKVIDKLSVEEPLSRVDLVCLDVFRQKLTEGHVNTIEALAYGIENLAHVLPSNAYNIQTALKELAFSLHPFSNRHQVALTFARLHLDPFHSHEQPIYNTLDLDNEYSRGFEDGYQRAVDNFKKLNATSNIDHLDID